MEKELKAPKLRFPGFTDDWEQRKLGEICEVTMGQSPDGSTYSDEPSDYILVQGNADLKDGWVVPRVWTTQKTKTAQAGDLIMSVRAPAGAMGKTAYDAVIGRGVAAIKGNEFIYQTLVKYDSDGYWKKLAAGSTFESVNSSEVKGAIINIPQDIKEQEKIGEYFSNLDNLITLHQRKLDTLKKLKKGFLQKMFPKNGESVPEIRFPGFTDAWEQRKLSDVTQFIRNGYNYKADGSRDYRYKITRIESISSGRINTERLGSLEDINENYRLEDGDILFSHINSLPYIANTAIYTDDMGEIYHGMNLLNIRAKSQEIAPYFLLHLLKNDTSRKWFRIVAKPAVNQASISTTEVGSFEFLMPSVPEQKKIAEYLCNLDNLITLHQRKLDTLKKFKQGMLQQMFI